MWRATASSRFTFTFYFPKISVRSFVKRENVKIAVLPAKNGDFWHPQ